MASLTHALNNFSLEISPRWASNPRPPPLALSALPRRRSNQAELLGLRYYCFRAVLSFLTKALISRLSFG